MTYKNAPASNANESARTSADYTKIGRITEALKHPRGLNRFEAERLGDHCLNSTIAVVRRIHGDALAQRWETVPTRYRSTGVRVLRYWLLDQEAA